MAVNPRVLSIQSHVVSGYVGNKSATFPLQVLGFDVDAINSVQFSNRIGYKVCLGQTLTEKDLGDLLDGLEKNEIDFYTHLLTGYTRSETFLGRISFLVQHLKTRNKNLIYVCDPVMGDGGKMYVPENLLSVYKDVIIPLADIVTPNQFELEVLTDSKINNMDDAWNAVDLLHKKGCRIVVVTSTELGNDQHLLTLASSKKGTGTNRLVVKIPKLPATFAGTGDLFAALLLAWLYKTNNQLDESLEKTISTLQAVLKRTLEYAKGDSSPQALELKLIQSKSDIEDPKIVVSAEKVL